jgi:NAD(P)-dependent dehydrogenase (short-subunit alcohol dehydrogenase family)
VITVSDLLLSGKVVLITGAASGIGATAAVAFAEHGARVALADINREGGIETVTTVEKGGGEALFIEADVRSETDVALMIRATVEHFGRVDCAFNNAGIDGQAGPLHQSTTENWHEVVGVNLTGVWLCLKYEITQMLEQGAGSIVNAASVAGLVGVHHGLSAYVAAKHGVVGLTRAAALEYAQQRIRVNAVCPGVVRTAMLADLIRQGAAAEEELAATTPLGRLGTTKEIAAAAAWLCSDVSSFVTGQALAIDGGWTAR